MTRRIMVAMAVLAVLPFTSGCKGSGDKKGKVIRNSGSDTMVNVAQTWAEEYPKAASDVTVEVSGGGSGVGIGNLIKGVTDIANASRDMSADEKKKIQGKTGKGPVETKVGYDALAIYVHPDNPVTELTMEQLAKIFGKENPAAKWSEVGIDGSKIGDGIVTVGRQNSSGTYQYFNEHVLGKKDFRKDIRQGSGSQEVVDMVAATKGAIGYSGMGYKNDKVKFVKIAKKAGDTSYEPTLENTLAGKYPLSRSLLMYSLADAPDYVQAYLKWVVGPKGQEILVKAGYIPLNAK
ncbi:MAG: phosphate ABC transporter substrate-binding protein [Phycisphaerae bacterium]|nr:phosphate ABC transporter substrate-binding protein [Phycisphaerae bacterium]